MDHRRLVEAYRKTLGVDAETGSPDHYRLLGLKPFEQDSRMIANAANATYAKLMKWQTSEYQREVAHLMHEVVAARKILQDDAQKSAYDAMLRGPGEPVNSPVVDRGSDTAIDVVSGKLLEDGPYFDTSSPARDALPALQPAEALATDDSGEASRLLEMHRAATQALENQPRASFDAAGAASTIFLRLRASEQFGAWCLSLLAICGMIAIIFGFKWVNSAVAKYRVTIEAAEDIEIGARRSWLETKIGWPTTEEAGGNVYVYEGYDCELRVTFSNNDVTVVDFQSPEKTYRYERTPDGVRMTKSRLVGGQKVTEVKEGKGRLRR